MFRLRVLSLHPAASAIGRVFIQGMGRHTSGVVCSSPMPLPAAADPSQGPSFSAVPTPVPKPGSCFHLFRDSDHRLVKRGWQSQKVGGELREFLRGQGEEFRLPARQITGVIHIETMTQVVSERNRFDRLIEPFGRLFQLLIVYPG